MGKLIPLNLSEFWTKVPDGSVTFDRHYIKVYVDGQLVLQVDRDLLAVFGFTFMEGDPTYIKFFTSVYASDDKESK